MSGGLMAPQPEVRIGERLRFYRQAKGKTQAVVAAAPVSRKSGQVRACPGRTRAQQGQPALATITTTEVSTV